MTTAKLEVLELFAGIGGIGRGLEQTGGFKVIGSVEIDEFCNQVRRRHHPDEPQWGDIREFPPPGYDGRPDVICGGSPCQDLSCAGKRAGLAGERSGLFHEMLRIVGELQPRWVIWENVRGAFSSNGGRDFLAVLYAFHDAGYDAEWCCLRASDFGYPHGRARVFLVAHRRGAQHAGARRRADIREEQGGECLSGAGCSELADRADELRWAQQREMERSESTRKGSSPKWTVCIGNRGAGNDGLEPGGSELADGRAAGRWQSERGGLPEEKETKARGGDRLTKYRGKQLAAGPRALRQRPAPGEQGQPAQQGEGLGDAKTVRDMGREIQTGNHKKTLCGRPSNMSQPASARYIPHAPPGPGLTHSRVNHIIKLYHEKPEEAKAIFEAEREQTDRWAEILERWPWLAPAIPATAPLEDFRRVADGLSARLGGHRQAWQIFARMYRLANAERAKALRAYGNAVVPACARYIGERILASERTSA